MPKHYKQSKKARRDESEGMKKRLDETQEYHKGKEYYGDGYGYPSNLSPDVKHMSYPKPYGDLTTEYPDNIKEIDSDLRDSYMKAARYPSDSMY